ncbi:alpha-L-glutamate ligase homolog [Phocoenobacter uteri]|uniref:Alpha-L-glutamate ligase homolog n=1 Tax=Phocoenobacter uteri TaxID=146806 RepID=A0A379CBS0_9PAST|nr:sugar-transfer associated ATP-grasp domain-containing protein [Phocoenobacter uteri]MDG6881124.1 hypothetical protein [Phocoenobacter uteri]SUB59146.1 alpha-L-glutamate ligase homolog [Phocoenobacter uteri]
MNNFFEKISIYMTLLSKYKYIWGKKKYLSQTIWTGEIFNEAIDNAFSRYLTSSELKDVSLKNKLINDVIYCYYKYDAIPNEYFFLNFRNSSEIIRKNIATNKFRDHVMINQVGLGNEGFEFFKNKYNCYSYLKKYFKRDICFIKNDVDKNYFIDFYTKHYSFIVKPLMGLRSIGIHIINRDDYCGSAEECYQFLKNQGDWIVEELIEQHNELSLLNQSSVNTIRIISFLTSKGFNVFKAYMKIGREGDLTDDVNGEGLNVIIDIKTGKIISDILEHKSNKHYGKHPDNGITLRDFQIPMWNELLIFVEEVHRAIPFYYPQVSWDFALTNSGWVLVEGNWGSLTFRDDDIIKKDEFMSFFD